MSDERTLEIIDAYADEFRDLALKFALALHDARAIRIHRGWVASVELRDVGMDAGRAAAEAATRSLVNCDWANVSDEVAFLYAPKREAKEAERVAAK